MINFRVTDIQGGMLTIERPTGQAISLKLAEIVRAQVMEVLPSGAVTLKLKGEQLIAKSQVPLQQGQSAFFKVTGLPVDGKDLMLQFIGVSNEEKQPNTDNVLSSQISTGNKPPLMTLLKELQNLIEQLKSSKSEQNTKNLRLQELNTEILKSLPEDVQRLPKEIRLQLQALLQNSLKLTGQSIQSKLSEILQNLNPDMLQSKSFENIKKELSLNIEQNLSSSFKGAIQDTGVALEAKLKNLVQINGTALSDDTNKLSKQPVDKALQADTIVKYNLNEIKENVKGLITTRDNTLEGQKSLSKGQPLSVDNSQINNDLKAKLLQMRHDIQEFKDRLEELIPQAKNNKAELSQISAKLSSVDTSLNKIDNLIKDIETFQALSKATNSFYTFLPVQWDNLKEGDISFKKGKRGNLQSYSCTLNLDLKEHGQLGIIIMQYGKDFYVSMRAENKDFQQKLTSNIKILDEAFQSKGMHLKSAKVFDFDKKEEFEMIEELSLDNRGVNITV